MTETAPRRLLPLLTGRHGGSRSALTCRFRCGDACFHDVPNTSAGEYFGDVAARAFSRRTALKAGAVVAAAGAATTCSASSPRSPPPASRATPASPAPPRA